MNIKELETELKRIVNKYCAENGSGALDFVQHIGFVMKNSSNWSVEDKALIYKELEKALEKVKPDVNSRLKEAFENKEGCLEYTRKWNTWTNIPQIINDLSKLSDSQNYKDFIDQIEPDLLHNLSLALSATESFCLELRALIEMRWKIINENWENSNRSERPTTIGDHKTPGASYHGRY